MGTPAMSFTLKKLIDLYRTDPDSSFSNLNYQVRVKHERLLARISREHGNYQLRNVRTRTLLGLHKTWLAGGKVAMAHALVSRLRVLFRFGATVLEDRDCARLLDAIGDIRFQTSRSHTLQMTAEQANAIRTVAKQNGMFSIAIAQAFQFELLMGQKDVIGEWVPSSEPDESLTTGEKKGKWLRGLRWECIDENLILRCTIGKSRRPIEVDLRTAPMVMAELGESDRPSLPATGPIIICEVTGYPYSTAEFRRKWRNVAKQAGLPNNVKNRDSTPPGMLVGGAGRARISQTITPQMISYSLRMLRKD
jgi:hypothetical protein